MNEQRKMARALIWIMLIFFILLVIPISLSALVYYLYGQGGDIAPVSDVEMELPYEYIPEEQNAFFLYAEAMEMASRISNKDSLRKIYDLFSNQTHLRWDEEAVEKAILSLDSTLIIAENSLTKKRRGRRKSKVKRKARENEVIVECTEQDLRDLEKGKIPQIIEQQPPGEIFFYLSDKPLLKKIDEGCWSIAEKYRLYQQKNELIIRNTRYIEDALDHEKIPLRIRDKITKKHYNLTDTAKVEIVEKGRAWRIVSKNTFTVTIKESQLEIFADIPFLDDYQDALHRIEKATKLPKCVAPQTDGEFRGVHITGARDISRLLCVHALKEHRRGNHHKAMQIVMQVLHIGRQIGSSGSYYLFITGIAIQEPAYQTLYQILRSTSFSPRELRQYLSRIPHPMRESVYRAVKADYQYSSRYLDKVITGEEMVGYSTSFEVRFFENLQRTFFFQPNRTRLWMQEWAKIRIASIEKTYQQGQIYIQKQKMDKPFSLLDGSDTTYLENAFGLKIWRMLQGWEPQLYMHNQILQVEVARTRIALKCYQLEHKKLPETLAELVPAYLPTIPYDNYDGKPLRYSLEKRQIYSIGEKLDPRVGNRRFTVDFR